MRVLGIDGSGLVASVAIVEDDNLIGEYTTGNKKTHSQTLLPMLDELLKMTEVELGSIDAIAVASGPGSFTGLRIASATAKGLAMVEDCPIVPVPTVDALAYNAWGSNCIICPIMDARRGQVYSGLYRFDDEGKLVTIHAQCAIDFVELSTIINSQNQPVIFLGDGVPVFREKISELIHVSYSFAPANMNRQHASTVACLGIQMFKNGIFESAAAHRPEYLRMSQAERERMAKENANANS